MFLCRFLSESPRGALTLTAAQPVPAPAGPALSRNSSGVLPGESLRLHLPRTAAATQLPGTISLLSVRFQYTGPLLYTLRYVQYPACLAMITYPVDRLPSPPLSLITRDVGPAGAWPRDVFIRNAKEESTVTIINLFVALNSADLQLHPSRQQ